MKRFFFFAALCVSAIALASCEFDDSDLWQKVDEMQQQIDTNTEDIATLTALVDALNRGKVITNVEQTEDGYTLTFSDGSTVSLRHGEKGDKGDKGDKGEDGTSGDSIFESIEETDTEVIITLTDGRVIVLPKKTDEESEDVATYELRILTFEDEDCSGDVELGEGKYYWSEFIPSMQAGSGHGGYWWIDEGNTELLFEPVMGSFGYYGGHAGISNYVGNDWENEGTYMYDLQAYNVTGGHSGTNFNTHFGYVDESAYGMNESLPTLYFWDEKARVIDHMWVTNTTYVYNQLQAAGFGSNYVLSDESTFKIVAFGYASMEDEEPTTSTEFYLLEEGKKFVTEWTKWDLSSLGAVVKISFNLVGSADMNGDYGLSVPAYFAYDDVAVRFDKE